MSEGTSPDPQDMRGTVEDSPSQWRDAIDLARSASFPDGADVDAVVVAGMGGSGIAADIAVAAAHDHGRVPVVASKGYDLPTWVGRRTLVVVVSYSGDTEETLSGLDAAVGSGATVLAVTSGGQVAVRADTEGFLAVRIPGGGQPRANLAYLAVPVLVGLERAGVLSGVEDQLDAVADHLEGELGRWRGGQEPSPAQLAEELDGRVPLFYGGRGWPAVAALRGKCQVNENAKRPAFWHELPELDHNEIVGWESTPEVRDRVTVVAIRSPQDEHPRVGRRFEVTAEVVAGDVAGWVEVEVDGPNPLARLAAGVLFVDLLSVHLALRDGYDPTPVERIATLKQRLAEHGEGS